MNIILTDIANLSTFLIPVVPANVKIKSNGSNQTKNTLLGNIRIIDNPDLKGLSWESFFPVNKNYNFVPWGALKNGWLYVTFIELMKKLKLPIRIVVTDKNKYILNMLVSIDDFSFQVDGVKDVQYSLSLTQFPENKLEFLCREAASKKYTARLALNNEQRQKYIKNGLMK